MVTRVAVVAFNTYREAVRARVLHGLLALSLATGGYALIVGAFSNRARLRVVSDLGAASIIRMIYRDGFFQADLHPGNLLILPGTKVGFIDLGMVGRLDDELRRGLM